MELVINIPKELYLAYKLNPPKLGDAGMDLIAQSIAAGKPLPEEHGRLIDRSVLEELCFYYPVAKNCLSNNLVISFEECDDGDCIWEDIFDYVPTVVEASKGEANDT